MPGSHEVLKASAKQQYVQNSTMLLENRKTLGKPSHEYNPLKGAYRHQFLNQISVATLEMVIPSGNTSDLAGQATLAGSLLGTEQQLTVQTRGWQVCKRVPEICKLQSLQRAQQAQELPAHTDSPGR